MLTIIMRSVLSLLFNSGLVYINIGITHILIITPFMSTVSWIIVIAISIMEILYLRSQWIRLNQKIKENK